MIKKPLDVINRPFRCCNTIQRQQARTVNNIRRSTNKIKQPYSTIAFILPNICSQLG